MFFLFLLFGSLLLAPQVVLAGELQFSFAQVNQCAPVSVSIKGTVPSSVPLPTNLLLLPFNATPISIPIPSSVANSSGVNITFIPLAENTTFIASLDDAEGESSAQVSDIFKVFPPVSPGNNSCVPTESFTPAYQLDGDISQCENFTVNYIRTAPSIRLFNPRGVSYPLQKITDDGKKATYTMVALRGTQVLLLMDDGDGNNQTSPLLTVNGDASSPKSCFPKQEQNNQAKTSSSSGVSKGTIIGLSVGLGVIVLVAIPLTWYAIRERRRRLRANRTLFDPSRMEKPSYDQSPYALKRDYTRSPSLPSRPPSLPEESPSHPPPPPPFFSGYPGYNTDGFVKDPVYVSEKYSPTISEHPRTSISWENVRRESADGYLTPDDYMRRMSSQNSLLSSSNIEKMLDMAARNSGLVSPKSALSQESFEPAPINPPALAHTSLRDRQPSNVPHNLSFLADSTFGEGDGIMYDSPQSMGSRLRPESDVQPKF